jgi:DNA-binding MurR/RpiR family transcriptional regulator
MTFSNGLLERISRESTDFTPTMKRIADAILDNPTETVNLSITQLMNKSKVGSESTVVRFYRQLGFESFHEFKVTMAAEIAGASFYNPYEEVRIDDSPSEVVKKIFNGSIMALKRNMESISGEAITEAVDLLEKSRRIICVGYGVSGSIANNLSFKLNLLGKDSLYCPDSHTNAITLSKLQKDDCVFAISHSGESKDVVLPLQKVRNTVRIIALTGYADSTLARIADLCITTSVPEEMNIRTDAIVSRCVQMVVVDSLFACLAVREGVDSLDTLSLSRKSLSYLKF